jgi:predicted nucleotidyltransferase
MPYGFSDQILQRITGAAQRHKEVEAVWLYGSRARGDHSNYSDIDLAILAPSLKDGGFGKIFCDFDDLPIVYPMDILHWEKTQKTALREEILADHKVLYTRV